MLHYEGLYKLTILLSLLVFFSSCAVDELQRPESGPPTGGLYLVWPPPPQKPRIQYLKTISGPADIGVKKSWLKRAIDTVLGKEEIEERILRPYGVYADTERVYVTDPGRHIVHIFDMNERRYLQIREVGDEEVVSPIGISSDTNGDIFLSDSVLKRVMVFDRNGRYLRDIGRPDIFLRPAGIAIDPDRVYVVDTHAHHVVVFDKKTGGMLFRFGQNGIEKGEFNYPTNIFIKDGILYIMDSMNFRVQIFSRDGDFLSSFGKLGDGSGDFSKPKGIAVDSEGHIYVSDAHFDTVQIFNRDGTLLLGFGNTGRKEGEMMLPAGVFIDRNDKIYVADSYNNRVQVFQYLKEKR